MILRLPRVVTESVSPFVSFSAGDNRFSQSGKSVCGERAACAAATRENSG